MKDAWWKAKARLVGSGILRNVLGTSHRRHALLLYQVSSFRLGDGPLTHQNIGQARELARALSEFGYDLDVVDYDERRRDLLERDYALVVDLHPVEHPLYEGRLTRGAKRISYITGSNPAFTNAAERARLDAVRERRGVSLAPRRHNPEFPRRAFESYDAMFLFGGRFALDSFEGFDLPPVHTLVNNGYDQVDPTDPSLRDAKRFLFLGGTGQVQKGLDLLLEVFVGAPDLELVVCSAFRKEPDFVRAYRRELFEAPNVHACGFVDVFSQAFRELQAGCAWMILPSCAEGQSGSVTAAMSYGLSPIVSEACGFEDPEIMTLPDCSMEAIGESVLAMAAQPRETVEARSNASLDLMRRKYRPKHYAASVRAGLRGVLGVGDNPADTADDASKRLQPRGE